MTRANQRTQTRAEQVAEHLKSRGHISEGSALIEYGRFRLGDAIFRLRTTHRHLIPKGHEIITIHKQDTKGDRYGEYHLVPSQAAAARKQLEAQRDRAVAEAELQGLDAAGH
jgi:hypothetical protein